jgi:AcrR family transcriptional regulator
MGAAIEHDERKKEILSKALEVFMEEGFEAATFQKIADRCGFTRTTLYIYFENKKEIFTLAIKQLLSGLENEMLAIEKEKDVPSPIKIARVLLRIVETLEENRRFLCVVLDYLLYISRTENPETRVKRRMVRLQHHLNALLIEGINSGEIKDIDVASANRICFSIVDMALYELAVLRKRTVKDIKQTIPTLVGKMCTKRSTQLQNWLG